MARLPIPGSDQGSWGQILNDYLSQSHQADGSLKSGAVTTGIIQDGSITEAKLDAAAQAKLNAGGGGGGSGVSSVNTRTGAVTLTAADVALGNVNNTSDASKPVSSATQTALNAKADSSALTSGLAGKADTSHTHAIADVSGLQAVLNNKVDTSLFTLDGLNDVTAAGASNGQSLVFNAGSWGPATVGSGGTVIDATASAKGVVQLAGDLGGTAAAPTVPGLTSKASTTTTITGTTSLTGGGSLAANRTITLVNDAATPGNSQYYGTNGSGAKGFYALPSTTIADGSVTKLKLSATGGTTGQVLSTDGTNLAWTTPATGGGGQTYTFRHISASATAAVSDYIFIDSVTSGAITITLPAPAANGYVRTKRLAAAGNSVQVVAPGGSYIDGSAVGSHTLNNQYDAQDFLSDGTNWYRV